MEIIETKSVKKSYSKNACEKLSKPSYEFDPIRVNVFRNISIQFPILPSLTKLWRIWLDSIPFESFRMRERSLQPNSIPVEVNKKDRTSSSTYPLKINLASKAWKKTDGKKKCKCTREEILVGKGVVLQLIFDAFERALIRLAAYSGTCLQQAGSLFT